MVTDANVTSVTESTSVVHESEVDHATLTQSAVQVQVPAEADIVRVQVTPGQTIQLPFAQGALVARLDDGSGNLAVKAGDITVILQGYAAATGEAEVTLIDMNGAAIDVAAVVAATDPNLDIATAAGQAAGDQGAGVDNNGGVFAPFDPAAGIGGLNAVGGLQATQLQYGLIERQTIEFEEDEAVDTAPVLVTLTPGHVVNEDDLERQEVEFAKALEPYPSYVLDGLDYHLGSGNYVYWAEPHEEGNDPFDTQDHEGGSQVPGLDDDANGVDQDREPLTSTAIASVNFFGDVPGHLSFTNGTTPIIEQLSAMGLTSHSHELLFVVLPGSPDTDPTAVDNSHGETLVAYYVETYGEGDKTTTIAHVVFTVGFREFEGVDAISDFNIDFTIYGVVDNVPGINDADGDILEALDIDVPFFMVDSNGSVTPAPVGSDAGGVTFTDIDDVPSFGWIKTEWVDDNEEEEGEGDVELFGGMSLPVGIIPSDDGIVHDESKDKQDPDDVNPAEYGFTIGDALEGTGWQNLTPLGAAITSVTASFGADGRAEGNVEAGKTAFKGDDDDWVNTDPNASAFQFVVGGGEVERGATNWTITGPDGQILVVHALQLDAQTIVGFANPADPDGDGNPDGPGGALAPLSPGSIPVFVIKIDGDIGQVVLVQFHQVNHADTTDADEATLPLQIYSQGETPITIAFQHDFNDLDGWTTVAGGNAAIVGPQNTADEQPNQSGQVQLQASGADATAIESLFGLAAGSLAAAANDGDASNGVEVPTVGTAIRSEINVAAGDKLSATFNFLDAEGGSDAATWQDFGFIIIGNEVIRLSNVGEANNYSFDYNEESGYLTFTYTFGATGPVQIGFGVMNEGDQSVNSALLVDQVLVTHGNEGMPIVVRATDYDGDYADLPYEVTIRDDGPSLTFSHYVNTHDGQGEGFPSAGSGFGYVDEDWLPDGNENKDLSVHDDIGGTKSVAVFDIDAGADGVKPGAVLFLDAATILVDGSSAVSLQRASDGATVRLVTSADGQTVTGYADADNSGAITVDEMVDVNKVLEIFVYKNAVEFELFQALEHDDTATPGIGDGNIESQIYFEVPVTLRDADGDSSTVSVGFVVDDDQINAVDDQLTVGGIDIVTQGTNLLSNDLVGADRPGEVDTITIDGKEYSVTAANGVTFSIGEDGLLSTPQNRIGLLHVDRNGDWWFEQEKNTDSPEGATIGFTYKAYDGDGDFDTALFEVELRHFRAPTFEDETAIVDEDGLPNGDYDDPEAPTNDGTKGDDVGGHQYNNLPDPASEAVFRNTLGNGFNWYGDVGTLKFSFADDAQLSTVVFQDGTVATLANVEGNGTDHLTIWDGVPGSSNKVLELTVIDPAAAVYEVKLWAPLQHPLQDNSMTPEVETGFEDNIDIPVTVTAANFGGSVDHTLTVVVDDDFMGQWGWSTKGPGTIYNGELYMWVDEDFLANGNQDKDANGNPNFGQGGDDPDLNVDPNSVIAGVQAQLVLSAVFGADGAGALPYGLAVLAPGTAFGANQWGGGSPLETTLGSSLKVLSSSASSLVISDMSDNPVMTLVCDQVTGLVTFNLLQALDHRGNNGENDAYLRFNVTYTDGDGDVRVDDIGFAIDDDQPETKNSTSGLSFAVDEKNLDADGTANYEWMFHPVNYGADGPGTVSYKLGGADGMPVADTVTAYKDTVSGEFIKLHQVDSNTIEGRTQIGGELVFVVKLDGQLVKFDLQRGIDHSGAEFDVTALALPIHVIQASSDLDGDVAIAVATSNMVVLVDDSKVDAINDGTFVISQTGKYEGTSLAANDKFGADGPGKVTKVTINNNDYPMVGSSVSIVLTGGTLTVNEDGTWYFNQPSLVPFAINYNFSYTISDGDGDTDSATFSVQPAVGKNEAPVAAGDLVISLTTGTTTVPEWTLLRNDSDKEGAALDVVNVASFVSGAGAHNAGTGAGGHVFFNDTGSTTGSSNGSFTYQATDGSTTSADALVSIDVRDVNNTFGTNNGEIIIGNANNNEISGQGGDDIILGGIGNDKLFGGTGTDWLFGESGDDTLIYDSQDKFDGSTGDDALYSNVAGTDFDFKSRSADGSHRMTDIEWVNLGDTNDATSNKVSIALNDVLDVNIASVSSPDGNIHQIDLFVAGDHEGGTRDGVDLSGFTRLDINGATGGSGTFTSWVVTDGEHHYQVWQGTNNLGQKITLAIEDGLNVVAS